MKRKVQVIPELKTGRRLLLIKFKKLPTFKMPSAFALAVFTVACVEDYYERGQSKYILIELTKFETSAR